MTEFEQIRELRMQRGNVKAQALALMDAARTAKRAMTADEEAQSETLTQQVETLTAEIERRERLLMPPEDERGRREQPGDGTARPKPVFRNLGEQLIAVVAASRDPSRADPRLVEVQRRTDELRAALGMNVGVPSEGGFLMETQYSAGIWQRAYNQGELTRRCFKIPIGDEASSVKIHGIDESSRVAGSRWGGVRAYWVAEAGTLTASAPKFSDLEFAPKKLAVVLYTTGEMLRNPTALEAVVNQIVPQEIAFMTEDALVNGSGAGKPLGVLNAGARVSVSKETGQGADTIVAENVMKMWARMWATSRANALWLVNQDAEPQLDQLSLAIGMGGVPLYMPAGGLSDSPYGRLKGRPVIPIEHCQTVGDEGDIILADWSQYGLSDRGGVEVASSIHVQFLTDQECFRFLYAVDGRPMWSSALTPAHGSNMLAPFVTLAARA